MAAISGKDGKVTKDQVPLAHVTRWRLTTTSDNLSYASSATGGFKKRLPGVKHGTGNFSFELNVDDAVTDQFDEGDEVTLLLYVDDDRYYTVPAVIDSLIVAVDVSSGEVVGGTASFSTNGAWTEPDYT